MLAVNLTAVSLTVKVGSSQPRRDKASQLPNEIRPKQAEACVFKSGFRDNNDVRIQWFYEQQFIC